MESNKSKGVNKRAGDYAHSYELYNGAEVSPKTASYHGFIAGYEAGRQDALAHPPQSEGVGQAAEGLTQGEKASCVQLIVDETAEFWLHPKYTGSKEAFYASIYDKYAPKFQPSEPAALKEFYCIGDKDNLFQCEEQCEDCKKGAALKEPQGNASAVVITDGEIDSRKYLPLDERLKKIDGIADVVDFEYAAKYDRALQLAEAQIESQFKGKSVSQPKKNGEKDDTIEGLWRRETSVAKIGSRYDIERACFYAGYRARQLKGKELTDGEVEKVADELWEQFGGDIHPYNRLCMNRDKFSAALKEFASLLTNHKS